MDWARYTKAKHNIEKLTGIRRVSVPGDQVAIWLYHGVLRCTNRETPAAL